MTAYISGTSQVQYAFFRGTGITSRAIKTITRGEYSHVGIFFPERDMIVEAWSSGGVLLNRFGARHKPGTEVDIFEYAQPPSVEQIAKGLKWLDRQMGRPYDFYGVFGFLLRHRETADSREAFFCSELALEFSREMGAPLLNAPAFKAHPSMLAWSPVLKKFRTRKTR